MLGPNSPRGSSRTSKCRHVGCGPTSKANAVNRCQRSHTGPRDWIASHAANTGDMCRMLRFLSSTIAIRMLIHSGFG
ncbi:hypothetical protein AOQ72_10540 [Bradyrhizobium yuanmingense]|uniref:Uncharacterized protein n=1 Tax=Bradyrhizobium yuanmingense TaxID=108015 RepID=A0A0R3D2V8_9BRAD|nr:hypothetical protein AOQ72_10540 [Bradyrhizobium yuanmingense]